MDLLVDMRATRAHGRLVPFLGSGMSRKVCRSWSGMVAALEHRAGLRENSDDDGSVDDLALANRAALALERLEHACGESVAECVRHAVLDATVGDPPDQTCALAESYWPLVLTTNYDDLYVAAAHAVQEHTRRQRRSDDPERAEARAAQARVSPITVLGRDSVDCHRVLSALRHPSPRLLWAMQGYLGGQAAVTDDQGAIVPYEQWARSRAGVDRLAAEVVVGHADYRRVALRDETFRRSFAEVFRDRSLLFLGSGLRDRYLLDLFGQVIELYGPSPHPHYAIAAVDDALDVGFLHRRYGIWVHEIAEHRDLPETIRALATQPPRVVMRRWDLHARSEEGASDERVTVIADPLIPPRDDPTACVVVSGGGSGGKPSLSGDTVDGLRQEKLLSGRQTLKRVPDRRFLWEAPRSKNGPLLLVARARLDPHGPGGRELRPVSDVVEPDDERFKGEANGRLWRDVRLITTTMHEVLDVARDRGCSTVVSTLWSAGRLRVSPASYTMFEMLRGWGTAPRRLPLTLHVRDDVAIRDLRANRLTPARALAAAGGEFGSGRIEFWVEIVIRNEVAVRALRFDEPGRSVREVLEDYSVTAADFWVLDVQPRPCLQWGRWTIATVLKWEDKHQRELSLERLGILHGSIVRAVRVGAGA